MVSIEPIKNQYLTALKERQQIIDKVNEIIKDLNNLNFDDLINLNNKIEEIKTEIAKIENDLSGKVNKNGDTMTGDLIINKSLPYLKLKGTGNKATNTNGGINAVQFLDSNDKEYGGVYSSKSAGTNNPTIELILFASGYNDARAYLSLVKTDTDAYASAPSWSVGTNDNSDKILTIKMANSLPSLAHTVGNEIIAGEKTFSGLLQISNAISFKGNDVYPDFRIRRSGTNGGNLSLFIGGDATKGAITVSSSGNSIAIGSDSVKAYGTPTPTDANGTEIATAGWVIAKINDFASKNNLIGL